MERIDLLWDAWEDCSCKEQLRAEFDRLKSEVQERDRLAQKLVQEVDRYINIAYDYKTERDEAQAENEKLKKQVAAEQAGKKWCERRGDDALERVRTLIDANDALQSQLDKISEPYHYSRDKAEYPWIRHEGKADGCPMCDPKCEHKNQKGE